ncbi:MAG: PA2169 family four-helix-bundle protein [Phycisphaerae bacterium]|nr:PA2169 family four-helix-bundle protein [Phycisphaerae bacterium]
MATTATTDTVSSLNSLIETLEDGKMGFETAAGNVKDANIRSTFNEFAMQRARMASELQAEVRKLGGEAQKSGSVAAAAHRGWINIKSALGGGEKAILDEAERGEDVAVHAYEKAMKEKLSPDVSTLVNRQFTEVKAAHDRVKALRDSWK